MPEREEDMIAYLSSGILKGVGPATAQRLVERFGADTLLVIEREPERLRCIKGITAQRAKELSDAFRALTGLRQLMEFLARYDLPVYLAMPLQRTYGDGAIQALRDDPYILSRAQYGVDFSIADEIAISLGFGGDDPCRLRAALTYELEHNAANGHVFLPREKLLFATSQLLAVTPDELELALDKLIEGFGVVEKTIAGVQGCYLPRLYQAETFVAERLLSLVRTPVEVLPRAEKVIDDIEKEQGVAYAPLQRQAVCPGRYAAADRRPRYRQDHVSAGHRVSVRAYGVGCGAAGAHRPRRQAPGRGDGPGGPDYPSCPGHELQ